MGVGYARENIPFKKAKKKVNNGRLWICDELNKKESNFYIESNNRFFSLIPVLWKLFPESKIVHIVRDGRDYVRSIMNRDHYTYKDKIFYKKDLRLKATDFPNDPYCEK